MGDSWYWTRDVDRGATVVQHARISQLSGLSLADIEGLTLRQWIGELTPASYKTREPTAVTPWIMAAGIKQARRRHGALAFCPECLASGGVALKTWRLAFHTHCEVHGRPLLDACPRCSAPFIPHLSRRSLLHCSSCGLDLRVAEVRSGMKPVADEGAQLAQARLRAWLDAAGVGDEEARHRLHAARVLLSLCWLGREEFLPAGCVPTRRAPRRLETLPLIQRIEAMQWLNKILQEWPEAFRSTASELGFSQRTFARYGLLGSWLNDEVERLPPGSGRVRAKRSVNLMQFLREPEEPNAAVVNWRAVRAKMLMREALRGH